MGDETAQAFRQERRRGLGLPGVCQPLQFNGPAYNRNLDQERLSGQILRIFFLMRDSAWRSLPEIAASTGDPEASISAQLRHLRKERFGSHTIEKRRRGDESSGLWEYRMTVNRTAP
jgi:hypothetical protein